MHCLLLVLVFTPAILASGLVGGELDADVKNPQIQSLHGFILKQLKSSNGGAENDIGELVSAKTQIVAGVLTTLNYKKSNGEKCSVSVLEQSWLKRKEITKSTCGHKLSKRALHKTSDTDSHLAMFSDFVKIHKKKYINKAEFKKRYLIFKSNLKKIKLLQDNEQGTAKYGVTEFSDLSSKEFKRYLGLKKPDVIPELAKAGIPDINLPDDFDWRHFNAVTPVKNQGSCGSCWAFSVTGNIEGQWAVKNGELLSLSEQEIVDCDTSDDGCNGGYMSTAYNSIVDMGGLETEKDYPYEGEDEKCHIDQSEIEVRISGGVNISKDENEMAKWLVANGPISVALNANVMQFYMGGVSHPYKFLCDPNSLDHGVLIVGYGTYTSKILKRTLPYWTVKNSWGTRWGESGYYRLYRGDGSCGINQMATSAVL